MLLLILSIPALFIGPLLSGLLVRSRRLREFGDGFILVSIGGLVLFHILPDSIRECGWPAFVACGLGMVMPLVFHFARTPGEKPGLNTAAFAPVLLTALAGVGVHAFLDGMALVHGHGQGDLLAFAVVLHRLSVGLTIWWILRPAFGTAAAAGMLIVIALLTPAGFFLGSSVYNQAWFALFQAFMAGSLLHVIYRTTPRPDHARTAEAVSDDAGRAETSHRLAALLGALTGFGSVLFLDFIQGQAPAHGGHGLFAARFLDWVIAVAPGLLLLSIVAAMLHPFLGREGDPAKDDADSTKPQDAAPGYFTRERFTACLRFGFVDLPARIYPWLLLGVFVLTLIDLLPEAGLHAILGLEASPWTGDWRGLARLISMAAVIIIFLLVLLRRGPRDFLDQITLSRKHG